MAPGVDDDGGEWWNDPDALMVRNLEVSRGTAISEQGADVVIRLEFLKVDGSTVAVGFTLPGMVLLAGAVRDVLEREAR